MSKCKCWDLGLKAGMEYEALRQFVRDTDGGCTHDPALCPTLDKQLRQAETVRDRRQMYAKRLQNQGYTKEEIESMPTKRRRSRNRIYDIGD